MTDSLQLGEDLDAVTGATVSSEGVAAAVRAATREIADEGLNVRCPPKHAHQFGWPEIILLLLFASGYLTHKWRNRRLEEAGPLGHADRRHGISRLRLHRCR